MAVTGIAGQGDASISQYAAPGGTNDGGQVQGQQEVNDEPTTVEDTGGGAGDENGGGGDTLGDQGSGQAGNGSNRDAEQVAVAADDRLPFTGLVVFPLVAGGLILLLTGLLMGRGVRRTRSQT
jgi:hypothetical protein